MVAYVHLSRMCVGGVVLRTVAKLPSFSAFVPPATLEI